MDTLRGMTAIALQPGIREYIIQAVSEGAHLSSIAASLGLAGKGQAISNALADDPDYQAARVSGLAERMDLRERELEQSDPTNVPRARELLSHARWRAEREAPRVWGAKQTEITINTGVSMDQALGQSAMALLDRMRTVSDVPPALPDGQDGQGEGSPGADR